MPQLMAGAMRQPGPGAGAVKDLIQAVRRQTALKIIRFLTGYRTARGKESS
jgi:hypothetical protein